MVCKECKSGDHDSCPELGKPYTSCSCQHRSGTFTTSTLNPDGTRTNGVFGATGARGSALTIEPELLEDVEIDPIAAIQAVYRRVVANNLYTVPPSSKITADEDPYVEPDAPWGHRSDADKHWSGAIASALPSFNLSPEELASDE